MIELLMAVSFVLLGTLILQGGFMRSAMMFGRYTHTLKVQHWVQEAAVEARLAALYSLSEEDPGQGSAATLDFDGKSFQLSQEISQLGEDLFAIRHTVVWAESGRPQEFKSETYAFKKELVQR